MTNAFDSAEVLELPDHNAWGRWLEANHDVSQGVWVAVGKKGRTRTMLTYEDAVVEAVRFGWIDSVTRHLDDDRLAQRFTPRRPHSGWSQSNRERATHLIAEGRMTPAGMAAVERAKASGDWDKH